MNVKIKKNVIISFENVIKRCLKTMEMRSVHLFDPLPLYFMKIFIHHKW